MFLDYLLNLYREIFHPLMIKYSCETRRIGNRERSSCIVIACRYNIGELHYSKATLTTLLYVIVAGQRTEVFCIRWSYPADRLSMNGVIDFRNLKRCRIQEADNLYFKMIFVGNVDPVIILLDQRVLSGCLWEKASLNVMKPILFINSFDDCHAVPLSKGGVLVVRYRIYQSLVLVIILQPKHLLDTSSNHLHDKNTFSGLAATIRTGY
ncbi:hypothetical protein H8356DRAFT_1361590 [Neocallimastix lanati (nom. inval.)]|nr:hypothetical protein H8356DRAFT_1361590 [Neocallimastix sp. JGI-2020a]